VFFVPSVVKQLARLDRALRILARLRFLAAHEAANVVFVAEEDEQRDGSCEGQIGTAARVEQPEQGGEAGHCRERGKGRNAKPGKQRDPHSHADQCRQRRESQAGAERMATPLPPRPLRNIEKTWPSTATSPAAAGSHARSNTRAASTTGSAPLPASTKSTKAAHRRPSARPTLVVPMLPLPTLRRSTPLPRATTTPVGNEPSRKVPARKRLAWALTR